MCKSTVNIHVYVMENFGKTSNSCEYRKVVSIMKNDLEEMMYNWKALVTLCACFQKMYVKHNETFIPCHTEIQELCHLYLNLADILS